MREVLQEWLIERLGATALSADAKRRIGEHIRSGLAGRTLMQ
jgi:hypothetical protein